MHLINDFKLGPPPAGWMTQRRLPCFCFKSMSWKSTAYKPADPRRKELFKNWCVHFVTNAINRRCASRCSTFQSAIKRNTIFRACTTRVVPSNISLTVFPAISSVWLSSFAISSINSETYAYWRLACLNWTPAFIKNSPLWPPHSSCHG